MKKTLLLLLLITTIPLTARDSIATFLYDVDFRTYFDNREYSDRYQTPQTIFNFRLTPTIGVGIHDHRGGEHRIMVGVNYTQPLGGDWDDVQFDPVAFYQLQFKGFQFALGAIPYEERFFRLPEYLMYDSISYYRPNIQGALIQYRSAKGFVELMCDWHGHQTPKRREMFRVMLNGEYRHQWLALGGLAYLNHKANYGGTAPHEGVADDIYLNPYVGFNVARYTPFDTLSLRTGYILAWQRDRTVDDSRIHHGALIELMLNWWFLGLRNTLYIGGNLMPFYGKYTSDLNQGDPFYQAKIYNRTDIFLYIYRTSFVNCFFSWNLHYDGHSLQNQQQIVVRFTLSGIKHRESEKRHSWGEGCLELW